MPGNLPLSGYMVSASSQHPRSVNHEDGASPQEAIIYLLEVWKAIHVSWGKVSPDEGCPMYFGDYFTAHHI